MRFSSSSGGRRFCAMVGARDILGSDSSLQLKIGGGAKKRISCLRVVLEPSDTYSVTFYAGRGLNCKVVSSHSDVYADDLRDLFTRETGFYTSL